jgi:hypothetical protein
MSSLLIGSPNAAAITSRQVSQLGPLKNGPKSCGLFIASTIPIGIMRRTGRQ